MLRCTLVCALTALGSCGSFCGWAGFVRGAPQTYQGNADASSAPDAQSHYASQEASLLVQLALDAELAGDSSRRRELLDKAIVADPDCAAARWHLGQVKFDGAWRTVEEVGELVANDGRWAHYGRQRDASDGSIDFEIALAQWCGRQGLANEERYHWNKVLLASPDNQTALQALKLRPYQGGRYTDEQITVFERNASQAQKDFQRLKPVYLRLCRAAMKRGADRESALAEIRETEDPAAIGALQFAVAHAGRHASDKACLEMRLAVVSALGNMPQHEATLGLVNTAVQAPWDEVRAAAAAALKSRPATDYVPLLMASLSAPLEAAVDVYTTPDGTFRITETFSREGPEADRSHVRTTNYEVNSAFADSNDPFEAARAYLANGERAAEQIAATQAQVEAANAAAEVRNQRIEAVLCATSGLTASFEPSIWWQAWQEYNELSYAEKPVERSFDEQSFVYTPPMPSLSMGECFAAGTEVWTQRGRTPIESISAGDMALAQNPDTGEIGYRPVIETSSRKAPRVIHIEAGGETIVATPGHRFWVNRRGWQMAKFLKESQQLHAISGALAVDSVVEGEGVECFNLVVDDFHTFFVGRSKLLVQDKTCPRPTIVSTPGSLTPREAVADGQQFGAADEESPFDE